MWPPRPQQNMHAHLIYKVDISIWKPETIRRHTWHAYMHDDESEIRETAVTGARIKGASLPC